MSEAGTGGGGAGSSSPSSSVERIVLDVGGYKYHTTVSTLRAQPSMLSVLFSGTYSLQASRLPDGSIFIDRDGQLFQYILFYLRQGQLDPSLHGAASVSLPLRRALLREARYFQLKGLIQLLQDEARPLRQTRAVMPRCSILDLSPPKSDMHDITGAVGMGGGAPPVAAAAAGALAAPLVGPAAAAAPPPAVGAPNANHGDHAIMLPHGMPRLKFNLMTTLGDVVHLACSDGSVISYDFRARRLLHVIKKHTDSVHAMALRDNILVTAGRDLHVKGIDCVSGELLFDLFNEHHRIMITAVQFLDDVLVSGSLDGTIIIWDMWRAKVMHVFKTPSQSCFGLTIVEASEDEGALQENIVVIECGASIFVASMETGRIIRDFVSCELVYVNPEQHSIIFYTQKSAPTFTLFDLRSMQVVSQWPKVSRAHIEAAAMNQSLLATGGEDGSIHVYDLTNGSLYNSFDAHQGFVQLQLVSPDVLITGDKGGRCLMFGSYDWDAIELIAVLIIPGRDRH